MAQTRVVRTAAQVRPIMVLQPLHALPDNTGTAHRALLLSRVVNTARAARIPPNPRAPGLLIVIGSRTAAVRIATIQAAAEHPSGKHSRLG